MASAHTKMRDAVRLAVGLEPDLVLWTNETGMATHGRAKVRYGLAVGSADLIGIHTQGGLGRFVAWEIKTGAAVQSPEQKRFQALVTRRGGAYAVIRSVTDAWAELGRLRSL